MKENRYQITINKIEAKEDFKNDTIKKMKVELNNTTFDSSKKDSRMKSIGDNKIYKFNKHKYKNIGTIAASFILIVAIMILINKQYNKSNNYVHENKELQIVEDENKIVNENESIDKNQSNMDKDNSYNINTEELASLPKLTVFNEFGGMGFGALMAYSVDELDSGNPWSEDANIVALPVFKNVFFINNSEEDKYGLSAEEMLDRCRTLADAMGLNIDNEYISPTEEEIKSYEEKTGEKANITSSMVSVESNGVEIRTTIDGNIRIYFKNSIKLPEEYGSFNWKSTKDEAKKNLKYLIDKYKYITGIKSPEFSLFGDYTYSGEQIFRYNVYEGDGELIDKILDYNFDIVSFAPSDRGGELSSISIIKTNLTELIGTYPIINVGEAKEALFNGNYITSVPVELQELELEECIKKVELIYRKSTAYDEYLMPYYEFLIEIPSMQLDNGLKTFGIYYVPAVKSEYISNMPVYNGGFN